VKKIGILALMLCGLAGCARVPDGVSSSDWRAVRKLPVRHTLPDPLRMKDGRPVTTASAWQQRRSEIVEMLEHYEYGHMPPAPGNLVAETVRSEPVFDGAATCFHIVLSMGPDHHIKMQFGLFVPAKAGPFPVLLDIEPVWDPVLAPVARQAVARGYIYAGFAKQDLDPDDADRSNGVHPWYPGYDWATLSAWAWGAMRGVDYLLTRPDVQSAHIALTGHSRAGKTALLAAALDERIALAAPHCSGAGGAGSFRLCPKNAESLELITQPKRFQYWFHPRLRAFAGQEERLPFDQHFLKALVAPRPVVSLEASEDYWSNPSGAEAMSRAAQPVFDLLGASEKNAFWIRPGGHDLTPADWTAVFDYCDHFFFDKPLA
jgi:hypothetical protein